MEGFINWIISLFADLIEYAVMYLPNMIMDMVKTFKKFWHFDEFNAFEIANAIKNNWGNLITILLAYHTVYTFVGMFFTRKFKETKKQHKYAILIAARNEEAVIGNLLDSINKQDYPQDKITVFVVADNCTDNTASVARSHGAICYERQNDTDKTKGFALQFLLERIEEDYGRQSFEGYFIFDADNLLKRDYITRMNEAFDSGEKIITSYRNTKNFGDNWISASYALHWLRSIRFSHRARSVFRLATNIQGTGFLFASELVKNGWKYTSLTEDRAFTADAVVQGYHISYCDRAEFYDEQPVNLRIALRQRIRWAKGHILAFFESGWGLFKNIFMAKGFRNKFMSYDMFMLITPRAIFSWFRRIIVGILYVAIVVDPKTLSFKIPLLNQISQLVTALGINMPIIGTIMIKNSVLGRILTVLWWRINWRLTGYWFPMMVKAAYVFFTERKRIVKMKFYKKVWFTIMWPFFDVIGTVSMYIALFKKVTWKPIPHESKINIEDVNEGLLGK